MSNGNHQKETSGQLPTTNDKQPQSAKAAQNVTQTRVPYWWIMRRRKL